MPQPRKFDTAVTVQRMRDVFWKKGYVGTSISDLVEATGVKSGSLHAAFGTKPDLFAAAFSSYGAHFEACMDTGLKGADAVARYMRDLSASVIADKERKGCLIVHSSTEIDAHTSGNRDAINDRMQAMHRFFVDRLAEDGIEDTALAASLFGATVAILALGRSAVPADVLTQIVEGALSAVPRHRHPH